MKYLFWCLVGMLRYPLYVPWCLLDGTGWTVRNSWSSWLAAGDCEALDHCPERWRHA